MTSIINEVSGDRAMNHLLGLVPYLRVRPPSEYDGNFRESVVLAAMAKSFGYSKVTTEKYQRAVRTWSGARAHARSR